MCLFHTTLTGTVIDTIKLEEICVVSPRHILYHEGTVSWKYDSATLSRFATADLGQLLSLTLPYPVMLYGPQGALSGILLRGSASNQTTVAWNGFPINSATTGTTDLSLITPGLSDGVSVNAGVPGSLFGYGNVGGVIFLENHPDFINRLNVTIHAGMGSFGTRQASLGTKLGNEAIQAHFNMFSRTSDNDFYFRDIYKPGSPLVQLEHSRFRHTGFSQGTFLNLKGGHQVEAGIWYQVKEMEIPSIMGATATGTAFQKDSVFRMYAGYTRRYNRSFFRIRSALFNEYIHYTDKDDPLDAFYSIDSRIRTLQLMNIAEYRVYLGDHLVADAGITAGGVTARVQSYGQRTVETKYGVFTGLRIAYPRWTTNLTMLKEWVTHYDPPVQTALNGTYRWSDRLVMKAKLSNHYRIPSLNDKYWIPGGNPDIRPEKGWSIDAGFSLGLLPSRVSQASLGLDITAFTSTIIDWIQWIPGADYWYPENYLRVWARGIESQLSGHLQTGRMKLQGEMNYFFTRSQNRKVQQGDGQLPYVPFHALTSKISVITGRFFLAWQGSVTGKRFSTADNSESYSLQPCYLHNLYAGWKAGKNKLAGEISVQVNNLFNEQYESIRAHAMPGTHILIQVVMSFSNTRSEIKQQK